MRKYKTLNEKQYKAVECEVKLMLHASRDCMRTQWRARPGETGVYDPKHTSWVASDGYYGEAFGIMRGLVALGYGFFGADNGVEAHNVKAWFSDICRRVLVEENFHGDNCCDFCLNYYGRDGAGRRFTSEAQASFRTDYTKLRKSLGLT
jgi:hypothetical protein